MTQVRTHSAGVKRSKPRTGTSKELFESYLQEWLWRQHYGDDPFGNIIKHIADLYKVRKDAQIDPFLVPLYALFMI